MSRSVDYTHEPLPEGRFIRLVSLYPSPSLESPLYIEITTHRLDEAPSYAALSYTWGDSPETVPIWCGRCVIRIRENLEGALRRFRNPEHPRQLWIDTLCINQNSTSEKNHQIPFMGEIYREAECVLIWLGEEEEESGLAIRLLASLPHIGSQNLHDTARSPSASQPETKKNPLLIQDILPRDNKAWSALKKLLQRPWFTRVWIIQEVCFAKHAIVICGSDCVSWSAMYKTNRQVRNELRDILGLLQNKLATIYNCQNPRSFVSVLIETHDSMSSEPRDKIYALLGLVEHRERMLDGFPGTIDYNIPVAHLYANVTRWCMSRAPRSLAFFLEVASTPGSVEDLPSWAIDWSLTWTHCHPYQWTWYTDWNEDFIILSTLGYEPNKLPLLGVQFDTVDVIGVAPAWNFRSPMFSESTFFEALQDWQNLVDNLIVGREDLVQTFFHTLLNYDLDKPRGQILRKVGFHKLCEQLGLYKLDAKCHTPKDAPKACKILHDHALWQVCGKKMCLTSSGQLCMCPERTKKGDVLVGLKMLETSSAEHSPWRNNASCVLRKEGPYYSLVGRCFVYGGVHGNGPLEVFVLV